MNSFVRDFCSANDTSSVKQMLDIFDNIDILYDHGIFFDFAISKGNEEICNALLTYFENKQFPVKNREYEDAKKKLVEVLENATDNIDLSLEMKKVLSPYIDFEGSVDSRDHDFDDCDLQLPISFEHDQNHEITTSGNVEHNYNNTEIIL